VHVQNCGFTPETCPLLKRVRFNLDPAACLAEHFQKPGAALVFAPPGANRDNLMSMLSEMGVEVFEIGLHLPVPEAASFLASHLATARVRNKKVALFAPGVKALRRWAENIWPSFRDILEAKPHLEASRLVMALEIADRETANLFGIDQEDLKPGQAAVLA